MAAKSLSRTTSKTAPPPASTPLLIPLTNLHLDIENPRLPEELQGGDEEYIAKHLLETAALGELARSFADNGYFIHEPMIVAPLKARANHFVVIEGNRRLATLRILMGEVSSASFADVVLSGERKRELRAIPCVSIEDRDLVHHYLGFRHIGGIKTWSSEAKARYVHGEVEAVVSRKPPDPDPFSTIARRFGSEKPAIRTFYLAFAILRHARSEFGLDVTRMQQHSERRFGVWQRCMSVPPLRDYIGLKETQTYEQIKTSLKHLKPKQLQEVLDDIAPKEGLPILGDSRDATAYGRILDNARARQALRRTQDLEVAKQIVDEASLPTRIRRLAKKADALLAEIKETEMTAELAAAIHELHGSARALWGLTKAE